MTLIPKLSSMPQVAISPILEHQSTMQLVYSALSCKNLVVVSLRMHQPPPWTLVTGHSVLRLLCRLPNSSASESEPLPEALQAPGDSLHRTLLVSTLELQSTPFGNVGSVLAHPIFLNLLPNACYKFQQH